MSSSPANKRSGAGSRRFNPLKALQQPKRRLQQMLAAQVAQRALPLPPPSPSPSPSPSLLPSFDYCRFIELDYIPMETGGFMVSMRPTRGCLTQKSPERQSPRRSPAPVSSRDPYGNASLSSSSTSGSCKGSDCSPTHRRNAGGGAKYTSCTDNHGIRPPPPEQYLTPLQQKEVCIRHLRARLKETVEVLQDRDSEIDELRGQLSRMQEDWIEEECHRVEAQLALKEAQREIQQLQEVVEVVRTSLTPSSSGQPDGPPPDTGVMHKCFQDIHLQNHKLETLLHSLEMAQAGSTHRHQQGETGGRAVAEDGAVMVVVPGQVASGMGRGEDGIGVAVGSGMGITSAMGGGEGPAMVPAELEGGEGVGMSGSAVVGPAMTSAMATATAPVIGGGGSSLSSCEGSPARSLTRSSTYTKLSEHAAPGDRSSCGSTCGSVCGASAHGGGGSTAGSVCGGSIHGGGSGTGSICGSSVHGGRGSVGGGGGSDSGSTAGLGEFACLSTEGTQDSGFVCCGDSQRASHTDLLLEAALLSKETASLLSSYSYSLPHSSSTYEHMVPLHYALGGPSGSASHPCLSHHHLYLHHLREQGIQTDCSTVAPMSAPAQGYGNNNNDLDTIAEQRTFRSQACSPTSTWMSDEGEDEELDESVTTVSVTTTTMTATTTAPEPASLLLPADPTEPDLEPVALPLDPPSQLSLEKPPEQPPEQLTEQLTEQLSEDSLNQQMGEPSEEPEPLLTSRSCTCSCSSSSGPPPPPAQVDKQRTQANGDAKHRSLSDSTSKRRSHSYADSKRRAHSDSAYISRDHGLATPQTCQPRGSGSPVGSLANGMTVVDLSHDGGEGEDGNREGQEGGSGEQGGMATVEGGAEGGASGPVVKSYWSRHFLVDLLAVAVPVVPTVAWLCHAPRREGQPLYHFGSLLRGCCTVALTSLRRGGGYRHYPAGSGGPPAQI